MTRGRTDPARRKTAVIIPYYQKEPGILRGAVESALSQEGVADLEIIVVDDGSPAPARGDLKDLYLPAHVTLKLLEQENRGPGAARNRALDNISADITYIAFLDSDDRWARSHLFNAHYILDHGYDMYFSDYFFIDKNISFFNRRGIRANRHVRLVGLGEFYRYIGGIRLEIMESRNFFTTSTVVYRFDGFSDLRFPESFYVGEDLTFALRFVERSEKIVFSPNVECISGAGIHIFEHSTWDTPRGIWMLSESMKWRKWLIGQMRMSREEEARNMAQIHELRRGFILSLLHQLIRLRGLRNKYIVRFVANDPVVLLYAVPVVFNKLIKKAKSWLMTRRAAG